MVPTVFAVLPATAIEYGVSRGLDRESLYAATRLTAAELADPDNLVPYESLILLWRVFSEQFADVPLGLDYGKLANMQLFGVVGQACMNAPTLGEALDMYVRYAALIDPFAMNSLFLGDDRTVVTLEHEPRVMALPELMEMLVTASCAVGRQLEDQFAKPRRVSFRHERRHPLPLYTDFFGCDVTFGAEAYTLEYPRVDLTVPPRGANPIAGRYLRQLTDRLSETVNRRGSRASSDPWLIELRAAIEHSLDVGDVRESTVATRLSTSSRSLQRALHERGLSFSDLLTEIRRERALALLQRPELSAADVAFLLGYSDARSFYRSFRQWHGVSPGEYRKARAGR